MIQEPRRNCRWLGFAVCMGDLSGVMGALERLLASSEASI
jgi:hypothetical protein